MLRRKYEDSLEHYGSSKYDFYETPEENSQILTDQIYKIIEPINAINDTGYDFSESVIEIENALPTFNNWEIPDSVKYYNREDNNILLLIRGDEIKDSSIYDRTLTNTGVTISTDHKKFGNGSLYFNGSANIQLPQIDLKDKDFTIDWWEYVTSASSESRFCSSYTSSTYGGLLLGYNGTLVYASSYADGTSWDLVSGATMFSNTLNEWVHWAVVRKDNTLKTYRNGTLFASTTISGAIGYSSSFNWIIGDYRYGDPSPFIGYINEFRVSNVARWTDNFDIPTDSHNFETDFVESEKIDLFKNETLYFPSSTEELTVACPYLAPKLGHLYYARISYITEDGFTCNNSGVGNYCVDSSAGDNEGAKLEFSKITNSNNIIISNSSIGQLLDPNFVSYQWKYKIFIDNGIKGCYISQPILINLTEEFGQGKEPTKAWCDKNIQYFPGKFFLRIERQQILPLDLTEVQLSAHEIYPISGSGTDCRAGCAGLCSSTCTSTCGTDCSSGCTGGCLSSCVGTCSSGCSGGCVSGCANNCRSDCSGLCKGCGNNCTGTCSGGCQETCTGGCKGTCTNTCTGTCTANCGEHCGSACAGSCTLDCTGSCQGGCYTGCGDACYTGCAAGCSANNCTGGCSAGCSTTCTGDCKGCTSCTGCSSCTSCSGCSGCGSGCSGTCSGGCTSCSGGCSGGCTGCGSGCSGSCSGGCGNTCKGCTGCSGGCKYSCGSSCTSGCT